MASPPPVQHARGPQPLHCQVESPPHFAEGAVRLSKVPVRRRLRLFLRRHVPLRARRALRRQQGRLLRHDAASARGAPAPTFRAGDVVRVRSREEIEATLDPWLMLRGCGFMPEMAPYCGTTQRVLKPVERFVDERDYKVKKARGVYLLEGLMCEGAQPYGPCDRGCLYFWRGEWLEPVATEHPDHAHA